MRVIAGRLGGRVLQAPRGTATRPTTDRVREALFSILGERVVGARVLDLFAGSGALGIEALSRGASYAVFLDSSRAAVAAIKKNLAQLGLVGQGAVLNLPLSRARAALGAERPFDIVFCDPPWSDTTPAARLVQKLSTEIMSPGALLVFEHRSSAAFDLSGEAPLMETDRRVWGDTAVSLFELSKQGTTENR